MKISRLFIITVFNLALLLSVPPVARCLINSPLEMTLSHFRRVICLDEQTYQYHKDTVQALSYTKMRAFRAFCSLPYTTAPQAVNALEKLVFYPLSFDQVEILETFFKSENASARQGWVLLEKSADLKFTANQAASGIGLIEKLEPGDFLAILDLLANLDDTGCWAAKALFNVPGINGKEVLKGLAMISGMNPVQHRATEKCCLMPEISPPIVLDIMTTLQHLPETDVNNSGALFSLTEISVEDKLALLHGFLAQSLKDQERSYDKRSSQQKSTLLDVFSGGSDYLIRKLNDLHSITDNYGAEIGMGRLVRSTDEQLWEIFNKLHPKVKKSYAAAFREGLETNKRFDAVTVLKEATARTRKLTARDMSSANIYILLSRGSELYDSSFRDILVPVLLTRIKTKHQANLLKFLVHTDPENSAVSDFIISCAQKGKLTAFFPQDPIQQRKILDLVSSSAFRDEQSLILFSATFNTLLEKIEPEVRTYLIDKIITTIQQPESTFALQLRVILQYYRDKNPELLSPTDISRITAIIGRYGVVDLAPYVTTDFARWKADDQLASLSIFQFDDDGRISYYSNSRNLVANGYRPRLSKTLELLPAHDRDQQQAKKLLALQHHNPTDMIRELYSLSTRAPVIVEWFKEVNGIELSHAVTVYQNEIRQQQLLKKFLEQEMEMFAQRGHSYWRGEQLIEPMQQLIKTGAISSDSLLAIDRFLSIGSCGGLRIYTQLNALFSNTIDILATVGTGKAIVNDPYNRQLFEIIATSPDNVNWEEINRRSAPIFAEGRGSDYLQPGSLPAILHKMMDIRELN